MRKNKTLRLIMTGLLVSTLASCSLDYNKLGDKAQLADTIPETILYNITQVKVKDGTISSKITAEKIETFKNKNTTYITNLHYTEINKQGQPVTEGWADTATYYTDSENAEIFGNIYFYSANEETGVYANYLNWDNGSKILYARPEEKVTVLRDDGSYIEGTGFKADFKTKTITFAGRVKGIYVDEDNKEKE